MNQTQTVFRKESGSIRILPGRGRGANVCADLGMMSPLVGRDACASKPITEK